MSAEILVVYYSRSGRTRSLVIVTHRLQVLDIVDRVIVLEQGRIVADGPRAKVVEQLSKGLKVPMGAPQ